MLGVMLGRLEARAPAGAVLPRLLRLPLLSAALRLLRPASLGRPSAPSDHRCIAERQRSDGEPHRGVPARSLRRSPGGPRAACCLGLLRQHRGHARRSKASWPAIRSPEKTRPAGRGGRRPQLGDSIPRCRCRRTVWRSGPTLRAMAETLRLCRFKSWIDTISAGRITCALASIAEGRWGGSAAAATLEGDGRTFADLEAARPAARATSVSAVGQIGRSAGHTSAHTVSGAQVVSCASAAASRSRRSLASSEAARWAGIRMATSAPILGRKRRNTRPASR